MGLAIWVGLAAPALAGPGDLMPRAIEEEAEALAILDPPPRGRVCQRPGALCWFSGSRNTIAVESTPLAVAPPHKKAGSLQVLAPRFARAASLAGTGVAPAATGGWTLELQATLKRPAWGGNAIFLIYDAEDTEALSARQFTALYQAAIPAGPQLSARLHLTGDEGFRAGRTYRVRVVQLIGGKEILLAEGDVTLI